MRGFDSRSRICGIDFSGAVDAGKKIWIATGIPQGETLLVEECGSAETLPGSARNRDQCLMALRNFIRQGRNRAFGMDFPFGLPKPLVTQGSWKEFVAAFPSLYESPEIFRKLCYSTAGGIELRRATDFESQTPFSPYNLRLYRQTYFGISEVLRPLVNANLACVLPMQRALAEKPWILEICPASTLKKIGQYSSYKGQSGQHRKERSRLLKEIESIGRLCIGNSRVRRGILEDRNGDALDSVIAAMATFHALRGEKALSSKAKDLYKIEGYVYA